MSATASRSRYYEPADLKKLFALSRNVCAFPGCDQRLADERWPHVACEICHIHGLNAEAARHLRGMSAKECNRYENLILLCRNHHHVIDNLEAGTYTADALLEMKHKHESRRADAWAKNDTALADAVRKLVLTENIVLMGDNLIRSRPDLREPKSEPSRSDSTKQVKLRDLARQLGMADDLMMQLSNDMGVGAKSINSSVIPQQADRIRRRFERDHTSGVVGAEPQGIETTNDDFNGASVDQRENAIGWLREHGVNTLQLARDGVVVTVVGRSVTVNYRESPPYKFDVESVDVIPALLRGRY